jgi:hypothetical protein
MTTKAWPSSPAVDRVKVPKYMKWEDRHKILVFPGNFKTDVRWNLVEEFILGHNNKHQPVIMMEQKHSAFANELSRRNGWDVLLFGQPTTVWSPEGHTLFMERAFNEATHLIVVPSKEGDEDAYLKFRDLAYPKVKGKVFR